MNDAGSVGMAVRWRRISGADSKNMIAINGLGGGPDPYEVSLRLGTRVFFFLARVIFFCGRREDGRETGIAQPARAAGPSDGGRE